MVLTRSNAKANSECVEQKEHFKNTSPQGVKKRTGRHAAAAKTIVQNTTKALKRHISNEKLKASRNKPERKAVNTHSERTFTNPVAIGDEDVLSRLPSDCLDAIFTLLNQDDLDEVSEISQLMKGAVDYARSRAIKTRASLFSLSQNTDSKTRYEVAIALRVRDSYGLQVYAMDTRKSGRLPDKFDQDLGFDWSGYLHLPQNNPEPDTNIEPVQHEIMEHILSRVERFEFERYQFIGIEINAQFLENFQNITGGLLKLLRFQRCALDKNLSSEGRQRFLSFLLASNSTELFLDFSRTEDKANFDEDFIRHFATAVAHPKLTIRNVNLPVSGDFLSVLTQFDQLRMRMLVLKPQQFLDMILDRLEIGTGSACWEVELDGQITDEMFSRIDQTKFTSQGSIIEKNGTRFKARLINIIKDTGRMTTQATIEDEVEEEFDTSDEDSDTY